MFAHVLHPGLPNRELALPMLFMHDLPFWVGGSAWRRCFPPR